MAQNHVGEILARFEKKGLRIAGMKWMHLKASQASAFYAEHREKPFFKSLISFMTSGPIVIVCLEGPEAIARSRQLMGNTSPEQAALGTLRRDFGEDGQKNAVHGSDSPRSAQREIAFFFTPQELSNRFVGAD